MKTFLRLGTLILLSWLALTANAEDIDIYTNAGSADNPNIIIALDNSSNWSAANQNWPTDGSPPVPCGNDCNKQGYYELKAIRSVVTGLPTASDGSIKVNLGLMLFNNSNASRDGAYVRSHLRPMTAANKTLFLNHIDTMIQNFNTETAASSVQYSAMLFDLFKYFGGFTNPTNAGLDAAPATNPTFDGVHIFGTEFWGSNNADGSKPDSAAYNGINYVPGISSSCAKNYVIFIGNGFPSGENQSSDFREVLAKLKNPASPATSIPEFDYVFQTATVGSWNDVAACRATCIAPPNTSTTEYQCVASNCGTGLQKIQSRTLSSTVVPVPPGTFTSQTCVPTATCATPANTEAMQYQCVQAGCAVDQQTVQQRAITWSAWSAGTAYQNASACTAAKPADTTTTQYRCTGTPAKTLQSRTLSVIGTWTNSSPVCLNSTATLPADTATTDYEFSTTGCTGTKLLQSRPVTTAITPGDWLDLNVCMSETLCSSTKPADTATTVYQCVRSNCSVGSVRLQTASATTTTTKQQPSSNNQYRYADEFADFLFNTDVSTLAGKQPVITYAIDVCKDQCNSNNGTYQTALMRNMASYGGGNYCKASSEAAIANCFQQALTDIMAVNSVFASASLPVNATNRSQNENQVYIGMFRPSPDARPLWYGNLKRYQFGFVDDIGNVDLVDANNIPAINYNTGFIGDCVTSFWTSHPTSSTEYWSNIISNPKPFGRCPDYRGTAYPAYADLPDGPFVEKGSVSQMLRLGNNPPYKGASPSTPSFAVNRTVKTVNAAGTALENYTLTTDDGLFVRGFDINNQRPGAPATSGSDTQDVRPTVHGDVVHSRPMPVNYGSGNVAIYYGANDGLFRAVNASTGKEMWAFLAPEFNGKIERLRSNTTKIYYPNTIYAPSDVTAPKDYFFDGGIGIYQTAATTGADAHTWIYPAMRRGGRMIYALDVTTSTGSGSSFNVVPELKWRFGCAPNATCYAGQATTADADVANIGQTWSQPVVTPLRVPGATASDPQENLLAVVFGGGYDNCEDGQSATPACGATKGNRIYVVNAATGALIRAFATERAVAAELVLADVNSDGKADLAYAVDLGGNIYRINFVNASNVRLAAADWDIQKIAQTSAPGRKFHYPPVILVNQGRVYLGVGSGDRERPLIGDYPYTNTATYPHRFYVYLDAPATHCPAGTASCATDNLDNTSLMNNVTAVASCTDATLNIVAGGAKKGWFRSLTQGEQVVTGAVITAGAVNFSTNKPEAASATACKGSLGEARGYRLDFFSGLPAITNTDGTCSTFQDFAGGGLPPSPVIARIKIYDTDGGDTGKLVTVCVGCASEVGGGSGSGLGGGRFKPTISGKRSRTYWYSETDKSN